MACKWGLTVDEGCVLTDMMLVIEDVLVSYDMTIDLLKTKVATEQLEESLAEYIKKINR